MKNTNKNRYEDFFKQKEQIAEKAQKLFLKKCKEQNFTTDFFEICRYLMIENDKRNIKNLKNYLLSDKFSKYVYENILEFENSESENTKSKNTKSQNEQFAFEDNDRSQTELELF